VPTLPTNPDVLRAAHRATGDAASLVGWIVPCDLASVVANLGFLHAGTTDVVVGMTMPGTVVAPDAPIRVVASDKQTVYGSFWSNVDVVVGPSGTVEVPSSNVFLNPSTLRAYPACP
jgi:hypothetical protein